MISRLGRMVTIARVFVKYAIFDLFLNITPARALRHVFLFSPTRWMSADTRSLPRGQRIRLAMEELGPVYVKLGQILSTRRDLLPPDIGDELALLQDRVAPFPSSQARERIERELDGKVETLFKSFENTPIASASVAQVHGAVLHDGREVVVKVLRPGIAEIIDLDVGLMYGIAGLAARLLPDGKRLRPREVVEEYNRTIRGELDLLSEATNAVVIRNNFKDSKTLYIPEVHWDYTRTGVMVQERIDGISIRDIDEMKRIGIDMKKLAEHGVEIFYTQVLQHNFFHADMHPGNIFVSRKTPEHPQYIAVDFGIVGSLTEEDQRYIGENLLAFFQRDYRRVAQLHVDSGWVPRDTRVSELEAGVRAVCEPIFDKPLREISFGQVLMQLFHVARRFEMEVQPQLVLLQKTLLNIEGLGRDLYPELDLWATGKPFLQRWILQKNDPKVYVKKLISQAPEVLRVLPQMPMLMHDFLELHNRLAGEQIAPTGAQSRAMMKVAANRSGRQLEGGSVRLRFTIAGAALVVSAALLASASMLATQGQTPLWIALLAGGGALCMLRGIWR